MFKRFQVGEQIRSGAFGKIYAAVQKSDNEPVVIKEAKWKLRKESTPVEIVNNQRVADAKCSGVNKMLTSQMSKTDRTYHIAFERRPMDLFDYLQLYKPDEADVRDIIRRVVEIVIEMKDKTGLIHMDLKPENILIDPTAKIIELCDIAFCAEDGDTLVHTSCIRGTIEFLAPECLFSAYWPRKSVVWAIGILAFSCLQHGEVPWDKWQEHLTVPFKDEDDDISTEARQFIMACLAPNPEDRYDVDYLPFMDWLRK